MDASSYTPGPVEVGWQIWFAAVVSTIPFVIGAYEFGKRIVSARGVGVWVHKGRGPNAGFDHPSTTDVPSFTHGCVLSDRHASNIIGVGVCCR